MLPSRSHWHIARERDPLREGRLLAFAGEGEDGGTADEEETPQTDGQQADPTQTQTTIAAAGRNHDGTPIEQAAERTQPQQRPSTPEQTAASVETQRQGTRSRAAAATQAEATQEKILTVQEVLTQVEAAFTEVTTLHKRMTDLKEMIDAAPLDSATRKKWQEDEILLGCESTTLSYFCTFLKTLLAWETLRCSPEHLMSEYRKFQTYHSGIKLDANEWQPGANRAEALLFEHASQHGDTVEHAIVLMQGGSLPSTFNESDRMMIQREAMDLRDGITPLLDLQRTVLHPISARADCLQQGIAKSGMKKVIEQLEKMKKEKDAAKEGASLWQELKAFPRSMGIAFYSVYEVIEAYKQVKSAYIDAWEQRVRLKAAGLANLAGKAFQKLPYGQDVEQVLESSINRKNDEVKDQYVSFLKNRNVGFRDLFVNTGNILTQNRHDSNRARAVLEYAASKGWLYHLQNEEFVDINHKRILRKWRLRDLLPAEWDEARANDYFSLLKSQNSNGEKQETGAAKNNIQARENTPAFIKNIEFELDGLNVWAALGIAERALERGLYAEVSPWIATTIYRKMQESKELRDLIPITWLDQIGSLGAYASYMTIGHIKSERPAIESWLSSGDDNIRNAGDLGKAISLIEEEILRSTNRSFKTPEEKYALNNFVAKVLAGQTLDEETPDLGLRRGTRITIFSDRYTAYRNNGNILGMRDLTGPGFKAEDSDYYTQRSDNILSSGTTYIMQHTANAQFVEPSKTQCYVAHILELYRELQAKGLKAEAENFRREMGEKLTINTEEKLGDSRTTGLVKFKTIVDKKETNELIYPTLVREGFIPIEIFVETFWKNAPNSGTGFAEALLDTFDPNLLAELKGLRNKYAKADTQAERDILERTYQSNMALWRGKMLRPTSWGRPSVPALAPGDAAGGAAAGTPAPTLAI